mmetsp:Transcript_19548/g.48687  ORF Transcript_19548/g.48687 Transcript_19548/m.48687 type:complete len:416 (-) Transcript_19548:161-1408(-)
MIAIRSATSSVRHCSSSSSSRIRKLPSYRGKSTAQIPPPTTTTVAASDSSVPVGASLLAAAAGIGVVSVAAMTVERSTADSCLPYSAHGNAQRFDQSTFSGRFARMLLACDPALLVHTEATVRAAQQALMEAEEDLLRYPQRRLSPRESRKLWETKRIVESALHPDTGEVIPRPFRMSGYVPYNGPICVSMVASTSTIPLLFWSWVNQSQNALVNYYNRNASSPMTNETLMKSYSAAVGSALVVAFGLSSFVQKRYSPAQAKQLMKYVAFPSAVVASSLNCYVVRSPEIDTGIPLFDEDGNDVLPHQKSSIAAKAGVESTTVSRAILQAPVYFIPSLLMGILPPLKALVAKHPTARVPLTTFLVLTSFGLGLPATIAIFPQVSEIRAQNVEEKYRHLIDPKTQQPYEVFYYNKGL